MGTALFASVPEHNYLDLVHHPERVPDFLELGTPDLVRAFRAPRPFRPARLPDDVRTRLVEVAIICERVAGHFRGDASRTALWFRTQNPLLGGLAPRDLIRAGRFPTLRNIVDAALAGNMP